MWTLASEHALGTAVVTSQRRENTYAALTGMNRQARNSIGEYYGNYYIIFLKPDFRQFPVKLINLMEF